MAAKKKARIVHRAKPAPRPTGTARPAPRQTKSIISPLQDAADALLAVLNRMESENAIRLPFAGYQEAKRVLLAAAR